MYLVHPQVFFSAAEVIVVELEAVFQSGTFYFTKCSRGLQEGSNFTRRLTNCFYNCVKWYMTKKKQRVRNPTAHLMPLRRSRSVLNAW